jgi:hypothetical protein
VAPLRAYPGRFQARRAGAHDHDLALRSVTGGDDLREGALAARGRVVDAQGIAAFVDAVDAVARADAGADAVLGARGDLVDDVRIGHVGPRHAHHVELVFADGIARRRDVVDAVRVEHGDGAELGADLAGEIDLRALRRAHVGDDVRQPLVRLDMALDDVDEIELAGGDQAPTDLQALVERDVAVEVLVEHHADADDVVGPDLAADLGDHLARKADPVVEGTAPFVGALVGAPGPERIHEMAVRLEFDAVEVALAGAACGIAVGADDAADVVVFGDLGKRLVRRLAHGGGRDDGQPVGRVMPGAPAHVRELRHDGAAACVHGLRDAAKVRHDRVGRDIEIAEGGR